MDSAILQMKMLRMKGDSFNGKKVVVSGSGNVAQYAIEKVIQLGGIPVTASDSDAFMIKKASPRKNWNFAGTEKCKRGRIKSMPINMVVNM